MNKFNKFMKVSSIILTHLPDFIDIINKCVELGKIISQEIKTKSLMEDLYGEQE